MAESFDGRFGVRVWGASTDGPTRIEFNDNFAALTSKAAIDTQGLLSSRPAAGISGRYYYATDSDVMYRDNGSAWKTVGSRSQDSMIASSGAAQVPLIANGASGQTADVFKAQVNGVDVASITKDGDITGRAFIGKSAVLTGTVVGTVVGDLKGAAGQTADIFRVRDNTSAELLKVTAVGVINGKYISAGDGSAALGVNAVTTPSSMALFTGVPSFEAYGKKGGASGAFTEYAYLHHQAADATVVTRRVGLLMQIGDASGDATKSGGIGIESAVANAANPDLILFRGDVVIGRFRADGTSTLDTKPTVNGTVTVVPGAAATIVSGNTAIGDQGSNNDLYARVASTGNVYIYAGGTHSDTSGDAGSGTRLLALSKVGSTGKLTTGAVRATNLGEVNPGAKDLVSAFGNEGGVHLGFSSNAIQAYSATTTVGILNANVYGGDVNIGGGLDFVNANGKFRINGKQLYIGASGPASPAVGDVWIEA